MFLDKLPTLSLRNKQAKLNDFLTSTLENLEGGLNREQKEGVESKNLDFFRKIDEFCKGVRKGMDGGDFKTIREMNEKVLKLPIDNDRNGYDYAEILKRNVIEGMQKQLKSKFQNESLLNEQSKTTESNRNQPTIDGTFFFSSSYISTSFLSFFLSSFSLFSSSNLYFPLIFNPPLPLPSISLLSPPSSLPPPFPPPLPPSPSPPPYFL